MGTVHKFKRPPKNEKQFRGYRPSPGGGASGKAKARWLSGWRLTAATWLGLIALATAFWFVKQLIAG